VTKALSDKKAIEKKFGETAFRLSQERSDFLCRKSWILLQARNGSIYGRSTNVAKFGMTRSAAFSSNHFF